MLRYVCPLFFVLVTYKISRRSLQAVSQIQACGLMVVFTVILLTISPEMAVAHAFACMVLLFPYRTFSARNAAIFSYIASVTVLVGVFAVAVRLHVFDGARSAGTGWASFPIAIAPHILLFFAIVFVGFCYLFLRLSWGETKDNTIALVVFSVPMIIPALSRCDSGHVLLNGMGLIIATCFYASRWPRVWKVYRAAFVLSFFGVGTLFCEWLYVRPLYAYRPIAVPAVIDFQALYPQVDPLAVGPDPWSTIRIFTELVRFLSLDEDRLWVL